MRIECPHCGAKGQIDESKRPPGAVSIRCPRCGGKISLDALAEAPPSEDAFSFEPVVAPQTSTQPEPAAPPPPSQPEAPQAREEEEARHFCSVCNNRFPREEMVRFGPSLVCASCKPLYVKMLEQGAAQPGNFRYGGFWIRFVAKLIDGIILTVINLAFSYLFSVILVTPDNPRTALVAGIISTLFNMAVAVAMTTWFLGSFGATPGKMALGLMVVRPDGSRISYLRAFGRYFAEILSSLILCIGYIMAAFDDEKRALHDRICDTRVIYK